jgi:hypothetical protein
LTISKIGVKVGLAYVTEQLKVSALSADKASSQMKQDYCSESALSFGECVG